VVKGKSVAVEWIAMEPDRRNVTLGHSALTESRGILIGYGHERLIHHYSTRSEGAFDVAWLDKDRRVVETARLPADSEEGVTSTREARYALLLSPGWLAAQQVAVGDTVEFSSSITAAPPDDLPEIKVGGVGVKVEVAAIEWDRQRGLMHRTGLSPHNGMLFVYRVARPLNFWMKNCHFPIDIAFFDAEGNLINVVAAHPYADPKNPPPEVRARSDREARYVLEVNLGWFREKGLAGEDGKPLKPARLELSAEAERLAREAP
jgi:hypothetical protein